MGLSSTVIGDKAFMFAKGRSATMGHCVACVGKSGHCFASLFLRGKGVGMALNGRDGISNAPGGSTCRGFGSNFVTLDGRVGRVCRGTRDSADLARRRMRTVVTRVRGGSDMNVSVICRAVRTGVAGPINMCLLPSCTNTFRLSGRGTLMRGVPTTLIGRHVGGLGTRVRASRGATMNRGCVSFSVRAPRNGAMDLSSFIDGGGCALVSF